MGTLYGHEHRALLREGRSRCRADLVASAWAEARGGPGGGPLPHPAQGAPAPFGVQPGSWAPSSTHTGMGTQLGGRPHPAERVSGKMGSPCVGWALQTCKDTKNPFLPRELHCVPVALTPHQPRLGCRTTPAGEKPVVGAVPQGGQSWVQAPKAIWGTYRTLMEGRSRSDSAAWARSPASGLDGATSTRVPGTSALENGCGCRNYLPAHSSRSRQFQGSVGRGSC